MGPDESIVLRLEVHRDAEPITGTLTEGDSEGHSFTGWLGLTDAIEAIRAAHESPPTGRDGPLNRMEGYR